MKLFSSRVTVIVAVLLTAFCTHAAAQSTVSPLPPPTSRVQTYSVQPDYRRCVAPVCGGWFITPVNVATIGFQTDEQAQLPSTSFAPIYVANINYKKMELTPEQIKILENQMAQGLVLVRGALQPYLWPINSPISRPALNTLIANGAWTAANNNPPRGSYLNVKSSGIVCVTTPCPYYEAELINTSRTSLFDQLNFEKVGLTADQELKAWRAVSAGGLVLTGVTYPFKGLTGEGTGIAASQVYFSYPK